jgi:hypothetical protein
MKLRKKLFEDYLNIILNQLKVVRAVVFCTCCSALRLDLARTIVDDDDSSTVIVCFDTFTDRLIYLINKSKMKNLFFLLLTTGN